MNNDKVHDNKFVIESVDSCGRICYDGFLSDDDVSILQSNVSDINYYIKAEDFGDDINDDDHRYANIVVKFYQSYDVIEIIRKMFGSHYNITLIYSGHAIIFNDCIIYDVKSLCRADDVFVEVKFTHKPRAGLHVKFEHSKI